MGLCSKPLCCLAWGDQALEPTDCLVGLMAISGRADSNEYFPELMLPVSSSLKWASATPNSAEDLSVLPRRSCLVSYGFTDFPPWLLVCTGLCVCPPRVEPLFSPVLWKSCNQTPVVFKARFSGGLFLLFPDLQLGSLTWGSEFSCGITSVV